jgi:hypothetical protein
MKTRKEVEYAESLGWKSDSKDDESFKKDDKRIWLCGSWRWDEKELFNGSSHWVMKIWWQCRDTVNGKLEPYETRREYQSLKETLENESNK